MKAFKLFLVGGSIVEGTAPDETGTALLNLSRYQNPATVAIEGGSLRIVDPDSVLAVTVENIPEPGKIGY